MNKKVLGIIVLIAIVVIVGAVVFMKPTEEKPEVSENNVEDKVADNGVTNTTNLSGISVVEELSQLVNQIYEGHEDELPALQTQIIDISNNDSVKSFTGLDNGEDLEFAVASEPLMTSQAYSLVLAKVKDGVNANEIARKMKDNIDNRKWICVTANAVYTTSSGNIVCLIMSNQQTASTIYAKFKILAGEVGQEYEKMEETIELPEDMY